MKDKKTDLTDTGKSNRNDITNSLEKGTTDAKLNKKQTPQGRTDIEQDQERRKHTK